MKNPELQRDATVHTPSLALQMIFALKYALSQEDVTVVNSLQVNSKLLWGHLLAVDLNHMRQLVADKLRTQERGTAMHTAWENFLHETYPYRKSRSAAPIAPLALGRMGDSVNTIDAHVYDRLTQIRDKLGSASVTADIILAGPVTPHDAVSVLLEVLRLNTELAKVVGILNRA